MWVNGTRTKLGHAGPISTLRQIKLLKSISNYERTGTGLGWAYGFNRGLHKTLNGPELNFDSSSFRFISLPHVAWPIATQSPAQSLTTAWHAMC